MSFHESLNESSSGIGKQVVPLPISTVVEAPAEDKPKRGLKFWLCFSSLLLPTFLMALDLTAISTPLPVIVLDLHGNEFEWAGSAYALSATALQPFCGGLAQVIGRRFVMLMQLFFFATGSAICGASPNLNIFILGRTIQGIGAGGIAAMGQIILGDLVPLQERGTFNGLIALAYTLGIGFGPLIGGALAKHTLWRWLFYLNLPLCAIAALIVFSFVKLKTPRGTWKEKIHMLDWTGNFLAVGSTTACVIALTWGGIKFSWGSFNVLVPLILGLLGLVAFIIYEAHVPKMPLVPLVVLKTRTAISGHLQTFCSMFLVISVIYYLPVYFQASKDATPVQGGILVFPVSQITMPFGLISGITVAKSGRYRPQLWFAWVMCIVGMSLFSTLDVDSSRAQYVIYQVILGIGMGILMTSTVFPVLSPLPVELSASALSFYMFSRYLSQIWGVTAGGAVLQNQLQKRLPADLLAQFPSDTSIAYSIIPSIRNMGEPLASEVRVAFAQSLRIFWLVLIGISCMGMISSLFMKGLPLHTSLDKDWSLEEEEKQRTEAPGLKYQV